MTHWRVLCFFCNLLLRSDLDRSCCMFFSTLEELFHKADPHQQDQEETLRFRGQWLRWPTQELFELCGKLHAFTSRASADFGALAGYWSVSLLKCVCKRNDRNRSVDRNESTSWHQRFWPIFITISSPNSKVVIYLNETDLHARHVFFNGANNANFGSLLIPFEIELADVEG